MADNNDNLNPAQKLARIVAEETNDGRRVVKFLVSAAEGEIEDFMPHHRMDAARQLIKIGLEEFADYIKNNSSSPCRRATGAPRQSSDTQLSPETQAARAELARYARELTDDGRSLVRFYSNVMDGELEQDGFKPHHRIAAANKLIAIGFGPASGPVRPVSDNSEPATEDPQTADSEDDAEEEAYLQMILAKIDKVIEETDPSEFEEENNSGRKPDYSMWDYIDTLPKPEITEEQARIGAAKFHEAVERQIRWKEYERDNPERYREIQRRKTNYDNSKRDYG